MMTEAGQIFAMLRSASAAELAKRFNLPGDSVAAPLPQTRPAGADPAPTGPAPGSAPAGGGKPGASAGQGVLPGAGATGAAGSVDPGAASAFAPGAEAADALLATRPAVLRAALSLASLAPPRADLLRALADATASGLSRMPGASGAGAAGTAPASEGARPGLGMSPTAWPGAASTVVDPAHASRAEAAVDSETTSQALVTQPTVRAGAALAAGLSGMMAAAQGAAGGAGQAAEAAGPGTAPGAATGGAAASVAGPAATATATAAAVGTGTAALAPGVDTPRAADAAALTVQTGAAVATPAGDAVNVTARTATPAQVAFAEAVIALIDAAGAGRTGSVASGVIFNAAMIPGWPFPSAFAKDAAEGINPKALLHRMATAVEGMTPQEAAEYLARIGGGHVLLRNLRKILTQLDMLEKEDVKGLLFSFLETLSAIASGLQTAFKLMAESAALQAAVAHGEVPEDDGRPGRRRLRL